jgi:hypothetical protein
MIYRANVLQLIMIIKILNFLLIIKYDKINMKFHDLNFFIKNTTSLGKKDWK